MNPGWHLGTAAKTLWQRTYSNGKVGHVLRDDTVGFKPWIALYDGVVIRRFPSDAAAKACVDGTAADRGAY